MTTKREVHVTHDFKYDIRADLTKIVALIIFGGIAVYLAIYKSSALTDFLVHFRWPW